MIFNSLVFLVFVSLFFSVYFFLKGRWRLAWILAASYVFYGWWDWRFLGLIMFSTGMDYLFGLYLEDARDHAQKKRIIIASVVMNLGFLSIFKYFNFFAASFAALLQTAGMEASWTTMQIILPVGISFYTFQSMSYTIEIYRSEMKAERDLLKYATFVGFWPQLMAGPIVRAKDLLPQFHLEREFEWTRFYSGLGRVLWGYFKKCVVADSLAPFADQCFQAPGSFGSLHLLIGVVLYSFQIYCDFSGYSDIAIGMARIMGYRFPENFRTPYFSQSFSEFWTRWHISLSSWLRDYLYIPLGGNRHGTLQTYRNNMLTMLLGGLWHGANWAFVFWGFLHGFYLILQRFTSPIWRRIVRFARIPGWLDAGICMLCVYVLTLLAWVYFRAGSMGAASFSTANAVLGGILSGHQFSWGAVINKFQVLKGVLLIGMLLAAELSNIRFHWNQLQLVSPVWRLAAFAVLLWMIALLGTFGANAFIYFQF
jgi:alginate O-acetyltransferase complex protein AlgI